MVSVAIALATAAIVVTASLVVLFEVWNSYIVGYAKALREAAEYYSYISSASIRITGYFFTGDGRSIVLNLTNTGSVSVELDNYTVAVVKYNSSSTPRLDILHWGKTIVPVDARVEPLTLYPGQLVALNLTLTYIPDPDSTIFITLSNKLGVKASYALHT